MNAIETISAHSDSVNDDTVTLMRRIVKEGELVEKNVILGEYETSKALTDFCANSSGKVHWIVDEGEEVPLGKPLCEIYANDDYANLGAEPIAGVVEHAPNSKNNDNRKRTLLISNKAAEIISRKGIDLNEINESFITTKELEKINEAIAEDCGVKPTHKPLKSLVGFTKAKENEIHYLSSVNSSGLISRINVSFDFNREVLPEFQSFIRTTPLPLLVFETSRLLSTYVNLNCHLNSDGAMENPNNISIGIAMDDGENGLKVPVIHDAHKLSLPEIEEAIFDLSTKYSDSKLSVKELEGATFTISDLSQLGVTGFHPLVNYKNSAILGVSGSDKKLILDLSFDHRISNGREASLFLKELERRIVARGYSSRIDEKVKVVECDKCLRKSNEDPDRFLIPIVNASGERYLCDLCFLGW